MLEDPGTHDRIHEATDASIGELDRMRNKPIARGMVRDASFDEEVDKRMNEQDDRNYRYEMKYKKVGQYK